ncbi:uncharacterized protein EV422DRAFT_563460 [Fimicolochytrium jonesii]|uniref:uncharacterized protein n=1 Tax=Fimicolochytrium jonesii TaxID=1396493 RepID=UPI0022FF0C80|nr:uncharacterized protein EV422DRAFT_563460 [Fimicolochytrium jonesii]KAI8825630.1 hypothetical protein EV422DRAFT_563460 [Fimicolochytrium jonesii]
MLAEHPKLATVGNGKRPTEENNPFAGGTDNWTVPESVKKHPYFVEVEGSMVDALYKLDQKMRDNNDHRLITHKKPHSMFGVQVETGQIGLYSWRGRPIVAIQPGNYWNMSLTHKAHGTKDVTEPFDFMGLTIGQVGQSGALVVEDPENRVFVIRNGGFCAFGSRGRFHILAVVDTLALGDACAIKESDGKRILGWKREVKRQNITVCTFLNIPANNVAIVQQGNNMLELEAGQHVITDPKTTFRGFYSLGERQVQLKTAPAYTVEGVPVVLNVNLRFRVAQPLLLTKNYDDAFLALANPAQTAVNAVVSRLSYTQFMRAKRIGGDVPDTDVIPWLDSFKNECLHELISQAASNGVAVESFDVLDRELSGALGKDLEHQAEIVLKNQMDATQVELQNSIKIQKQSGLLEVARVQAEQTKTDSDAQYYAATRVTDAQIYDQLKKAKAAAESSQVQAEQEAKNIVTIAEAKVIEIGALSRAYGDVAQDHAKRIQLETLEVEKRKALPAKTVYFAGSDSSIASTVAQGFGFQSGANLDK